MTSSTPEFLSLGSSVLSEAATRQNRRHPATVDCCCRRDSPASIPAAAAAAAAAGGVDRDDVAGRSRDAELLPVVRADRK